MNNTVEEWNSYWSYKKNLIGKLYDFLASFYRRRLISGSLYYFLDKNFSKGSKLVHVGCGGGEVDVFLSQFFEITAVDFSKKALAVYKKNNQLVKNVLLADAFALPIDDGVFDGAYNLGVFEHYNDNEVVLILREMSRVVKKGGKIVIFWPPEYGLSVIFFKIFYFFVHIDKVKLYPAEVNRLKGKNQASLVFSKAGIKLIDFYFGWRDLLTYCVLVGEVV